MELQEKILNEAVANGVCDKFKKELQQEGLSDDQLCMMYHRGLDFCIEHNFPSQEIVQMFDKDVLYRNGIYYDYKGIADTRSHFIVANGESDIDLTIDGVVSLYVRDNSVARLRLTRDAFVYVTLRDNATVEIVSRDDDAKAYMSYYSGTIVNEDKFDQIHYK